MTTNVISNDQFEKIRIERFGLHVARRLTLLPDDVSRQRLETEIQKAILNAEKQAMLSASPSTSNIITFAEYPFQNSHEDQFCEFVSQRIAELPNYLIRYKLEIEIQEAIVKAEEKLQNVNA